LSTLTITCDCGVRLTTGIGASIWPPQLLTCPGCTRRFQVDTANDTVGVTHLGRETEAVDGPLQSIDTKTVRASWKTLGMLWLLGRFAERDAKAYLDLLRRDS
jgi:hypothetical protein